MACERSRLTTSVASAVVIAISLLGFAASHVVVLSAAQTEASADNTLVDTLRVLDRAIHLLGDSSSNYRKVLMDALSAFPGNAGEEAAGPIRTFLMRAPQPGDEFKCSADFVRSRARTTLLRIRDTLRKEYVSPVDPAVCYTVPFALDLTRVQATGGWLDIYGYDFDQVTPEMVLVTSGGILDVSAALVARSHYHLALKFGDGAVPLTSGSVSLGLTWGHLIHHSIAIVQPSSRLCSARVETLPAGRTLEYSPPRITGGSTPGQPGTTVWADATLDYSSNKLEATICMAGDSSTRGAFFGGCTVEFLHTIDPDWVIEAVLGGLHSRVSYGRGGRTSDVRSGTRDGPVRQWVFDGFESSRVEGGSPSVTARLNEIRVVAAEDGACVSPIAYLEAKKTSGLDAVTRKSLDPQLEKIDPTILKVRPRFAPR